MSTSTRLLIATAAVLACLLGCGGDAADRVDLLFRGGTLIDGSGGPPQSVDVAVRDGRIAAIGRLDGLAAEREVDVSGLVLTPGFVDMHSHADLVLLGDPATQQRLLEAKIRQGVTTIVVGNCGLGAAPTDAAAAEILAGVNSWMTPQGVRSPELSVGGYLDRLDSNGVALNVATLVPHGPVRITAMGLRPGAPDETELEAMRRSVRAGLDQGAFGLSTGLIYPPGMYSATDELIELARVVAERDRLYTTHVRGSSETLLQATEELIEIARNSGARVHHSHLEAVGRRFWPAVRRVLELEDRARADGLRVTHDAFPYTRAATMMAAIFPPWSLEGGVPALLERLQDPEQRERIRSELEQRVPEWPPWRPGGWPHNLVGAVGWHGILVASVAPHGPHELVGSSLAVLAERQGRHPFEVVADLMVDQQGQVGQLVDEISGQRGEIDTLLAILVHPAAAIVSDAEDYGRGSPHPAHAGAFVRALRLSRERGLLPLEEAVRRMTSYPAALVGLGDRGLIEVGAPADLVAFDPQRVTDRADWDDPRRHAGGLSWVLLNGQPVVEDGSYRGGLHGVVLRARD